MKQRSNSPERGAVHSHKPTDPVVTTEDLETTLPEPSEAWKHAFDSKLKEKTKPALDAASHVDRRGSYVRK